MKAGRTELKLYGLEYKLNVMSGAHFILKLNICPVVSRIRAKDMRIMGQNKQHYYSQHIKHHEHHVLVGILCPPKFYRGNVEEPNRYYTPQKVFTIPKAR